MRISLALCVGVTLLGLFTGCKAATAADLPDGSYYQLDVLLETQAAEQLRFAEMAGGPVLVAMFYGSCPHVCPMTISTIRAMEDRITDGEREQLRVLMISIDPARDTPEALEELAARHKVDRSRWRFARTAAADVRAVAAVLGVKYRELPDGSFNHTSPILLLDEHGVELARTDKLGIPNDGFVQELQAALAAQ